MKHSEILRKAKRVLWDGNTERYAPEYICNALYHFWDYENEERNQKISDIKAYINESLTKGLTKKQKIEVVGHGVGAWLKVKGFKVDNRKELQEYRHRWLDHMINEYEKAGK